MALIAMVGAGVAMTTSQKWAVWIAVAVAVGGIVVAWWNGALADVNAARSSREEVHDLETGSSHPGVLPGDRNEDGRAKADSARAEGLASSAKDQSPRATLPASTYARGYGSAVMLGGVWLLATVPTYALEAASRATSLRQAGFGIVLALLGLRLLAIRASFPTAVASVAAASLYLTSMVVWWPPQAWVAMAGLTGAGVAFVAAGAATIAARRSR